MERQKAAKLRLRADLFKSQLRGATDEFDGFQGKARTEPQQDTASTRFDRSQLAPQHEENRWTGYVPKLPKDGPTWLEGFVRNLQRALHTIEKVGTSGMNAPKVDLGRIGFS